MRLWIQFLLSTVATLCILSWFTYALPAERGTKILDCERDAYPIVRVRREHHQQFKVQNNFERANDLLAHGIRPDPLISDDCEGDACSQVTITWEEAKERYKVQNSSADQWVKVEAANLAATAATCVEPSKEAYLSLKSIVGPYKAKFDTTCAVD